MANITIVLPSARITITPTVTSFESPIKGLPVQLVADVEWIDETKYRSLAIEVGTDSANAAQSFVTSAIGRATVTRYIRLPSFMTDAEQPQLVRVARPILEPIEEVALRRQLANTKAMYHLGGTLNNIKRIHLTIVH